MTTTDNKESGFKFVDRRRFDESGEARQVEEAKTIEQPKAEAPLRKRHCLQLTPRMAPSPFLSFCSLWLNKR
jgi:hypothetical protein